MISDSGISADNARFLEEAIAQGLFPSRETAIDRGLQLLCERHQAIEKMALRHSCWRSTRGCGSSLAIAGVDFGSVFA